VKMGDLVQLRGDDSLGLVIDEPVTRQDGVYAGSRKARVYWLDEDKVYWETTNWLEVISESR
jgi:hypothetical protein